MRILMITDSYPHDEKPHLTTFHHEHAKVLSRIGDVKVLTLIRGKKFGFRRYIWEGIEVEAFEMPYRRGMGPVFFPLSIVLHFLQSSRALRKFEPDAVILQMALPHGIAYLPLKRNKKYILVEHSSSAYRKNLRLERMVARGAFRRYTVSSFYRNLLEERLGVDFHGVIPNPVMVEERECRAESGRVIFVGRLDENKAPHLYVEAARFLPHIRFVLVGEDTKTSYSRQILSNPPPNVEYTGPLPREEVLDRICGSDMLVSTSRFETFGYAIAEALALGKPVVWTDSGGPGDFLNERNSVLVKERTPQAVARAIEEAYRKLKGGYFDPDEIREGILRYAGVDAVEKKYRQVMEELLEAGH